MKTSLTVSLTTKEKTYLCGERLKICRFYILAVTMQLKFRIESFEDGELQSLWWARWAPGPAGLIEKSSSTNDTWSRCWKPWQPGDRGHIIGWQVQVFINSQQPPLQLSPWNSTIQRHQNRDQKCPCLFWLPQCITKRKHRTDRENSNICLTQISQVGSLLEMCPRFWLCTKRKMLCNFHINFGW